MNKLYEVDRKTVDVSETVKVKFTVFEDTNTFGEHVIEYFLYDTAEGDGLRVNPFLGPDDVVVVLEAIKEYANHNGLTRVSMPKGGRVRYSRPNVTRAQMETLNEQHDLLLLECLEDGGALALRTQHFEDIVVIDTSGAFLTVPDYYEVS
jgi:hypothetical protein